MRFIDLFAGLGGFHLALQRLGHECVFASEVEPGLREVYRTNFEMPIEGDIQKVDARDIGHHEVLCAGFPCQPFSKAGFQDGFEHATDGTLFHEILRIVDHHRPEFLILENVANFERHDGGNTWRVAERSLRQLGYDVAMAKLSPNQFGVPQIRERVYIVGRRGSLDGFLWPDKGDGTDLSIETVLEREPSNARSIPDNLRQAITAWQAFLDRYPRDEQLPSFPIWSAEFGATYPGSGIDGMTLKELRSRRGAHGRSLESVTRWDHVWSLLPSYAMEGQFPRWKRKFIRQNRDLYARNRDWIDEWLPSLAGLPASFQKLEWNCHGEDRQLSRYILQARPSGIRVKRPNWSPSLVALTTTQVPIIGWESRYLTLTECKRLQSMDQLKHLPIQTTKAYEALGNAVNVEVVTRIAERLLDGVGIATAGAEVQATHVVSPMPAR